MTYVTRDEYQRFQDKCLAVLDQQVLPLEAEESKKAAIQAVHRVFRQILADDGLEVMLSIMKMPKRIILPKID